jgi:hypothetical protein
MGWTNCERTKPLSSGLTANNHGWTEGTFGWTKGIFGWIKGTLRGI